MDLRKTYPFLPIFLAFLISINFFWILPLIPGFDSPFYLTEIRRFAGSLSNPLSYLYPDRYLSIAFPGLLTKLFSLDPVISYRISITLVYILVAFALQKLIQNITKNDRVSTLISSGFVISPFLIIYSSTLYANFAGLLVIFFFFAVETSNNFKYKNVILGMIFGLIFYTHNFTSVSFGLIIATYFLIKSIFYKDIKVIRSAITIFVIAVIVGSLALYRYLPVKTATAYASRGGDMVLNFVRRINLQSQPIILGNEKERIISAFNDHTGKYWMYFFFIFSSFSLITKFKEIIKEKKQFILPLAILVPSLLLSFQPLWGTNWLPERCVTFVSLSTFFFYISLITLPSFKKYIVILAVIPLFINYIDSDNLIMNKGYRPFSDNEISTYNFINISIKNETSIVLLPSDHYYWARYFLENYTILSGDHFISCGVVDKIVGYGEINYAVAKIFGSDNIAESEKFLNILKMSYRDNRMYFIVDDSLGCSNGKIINKLQGIKEIYKLNNWHLYEVN